jgi:succinate dehydrogenase / fumarate reductase, cytochrome b subunit
MSSRNRFLDSSVGSKFLIGATGFLLVLYLLIHIGGNLMVFGGRDFFNAYAHTLASNPLLPLIELALLLVFLFHIYRTIKMFAGNKAARPVAYAVKKPAGHTSRKSLASTTMIVSGLWLVLFLVVHVKAFRFGAHYPLADGSNDLFRVEMEALRNPLIVLFYVLSMVVVGSHLYHGVASSLQSLGLSHPRWTPRFLAVGKGLAAAIAAGFIAIALWAYSIGQGAL